nr:radical SAM protein [Candidatus Sigynarchaeota archaeon]
MDTHAFEFKVELLFKGLRLLDEPSSPPAQGGPVLDERNIDSVARKGGAGPAGGIYVQHHDFFQANVPLQSQMTEHSDILIKQVPREGDFQTFKRDAKGTLVEYKRLFKIPDPSFYSDEYYPKERLGVGTPVPYKKIALVHGWNCVATTINQACKYWRCGSQCLFCAIEESLKDGNSIPRKDPDAIVAFTERARKEKRVAHFTLTSGTQDGPDGGALEYIPVVEALKSNFKYPVHVQVAPVSNLDVLDKLYYAGVDNVGIHVETYPESNRRVYCPGKSEIPIKQFERNWDYAVGLFGDNQVESYLLAGLGESFDMFKAAVDLLVSHEVIPLVVPARPILNTTFEKNTLKDSHALIEYYVYAGKKLHEQGLHPKKAVAGCTRCGACSAIIEAKDVASSYP